MQSRYYDPETGRFISMDSIEYLDPETIHGLNLYAYCGNNPVMAIDPSGHSLLVVLVAAAIGFGLSYKDGRLKIGASFWFGFSITIKIF